MQTTHSDRVSGWIVLGLIGIIVVCIVTSAFATHLTSIGQNQLQSIAIGAVGGLVGALNIRRPSSINDSSTSTMLLPIGKAEEKEKL